MIRSSSGPRYGLARVLSKLGVCSRAQAERWIRQGRVSVAGRVVWDPMAPSQLSSTGILLDGQPVAAQRPVYLMLNKPRGIVVSAADERGRDTVYGLIDDPALPWIAPVGRLDKASEGLLLLSNDTRWAAAITDADQAGAAGVSKTYHVQLQGLPDAGALAALCAGIDDQGERLMASRVDWLRQGERNAWLEFELHQGRNRQIRRMCAAVGHPVLRLLRVAIGPLPLGDLAKGQWRHLTTDEVAALTAVR